MTTIIVDRERSVSSAIRSFVLGMGLVVAFACQASATTQSVIAGPAGSVEFGSTVTVLPNGNFVVTDPYFGLSSPVTVHVGAVFLYSPYGIEISRMTGSLSEDQVGGTIVVLSNGDFVVSSGSWNKPTGGIPPNDRVATVGAVTKCSGTTGCPAQVTAANSLIGGTANDSIGLFVTSIGTGNYVVGSPSWRPNSSLSGVGATTLCNGTTNSCSNKIVSPANSLVGTTSSDLVGSGNVTVLTNGDYVVASSNWDNGSVTDAGAVTRCSGTSGCIGAITAANSLTGKLGDGVGGGIGGVFSLPNNQYLVATPNWSISISLPGQQGAVTLCSNTSGNCTGQMVTAANSLTGTTYLDQIGAPRDGTNWDVWTLPSGDYIIGSPYWDLPGQNSVQDVGAVTLCRAANNSCAGQAVSTVNSITGNILGSNIGSGRIVLLPGGNYVVSSPNWRPETFNHNQFGAATLCNAAGNGCAGTIVSASNSLVGSSVGDSVSGVSPNAYSPATAGVTAMPNGGYVVSSPQWSNGAPQFISIGAVTLCSGPTGCTGPISTGNSLTGSHSSDYVGFGGTTALSNGGYVVNSPYWFVGQNFAPLGAATLCSGVNNCAGQIVTAANSLTGAIQDNYVGGYTVALANGNYVVVSPNWDGAVTDAGAATFCNADANSCASLQVSVSNSLVGSTQYDYVGQYSVGTGHVVALPNGNYIVSSPQWDSGPVTDAGGFTVGGGVTGVSGPVSAANSVLGVTPGGGPYGNFASDGSGDETVVGLAKDDKVVLIRAAGRNSTSDFDGDGKTDISVFRPSNNIWYLDRSQAGFTGYQFGGPGDLLTPADFTGDGKTDVSVFRPSTGTWYVLRSEDTTFYAVGFGTNGDIPAPGDYDGDGKADLAVFRPSQGTWYIQRSTAGFLATQFGTEGDLPSVGDFDGDGKSDIALYRPSTGIWYRVNSSNGSFFGVQFGAAGDKIVPADYTGDGKADVAVWRPSNGAWYVLRSEDLSFFSVQFGALGDLPTPGDYDGDGKADFAVYRPSQGIWYEQRSAAGFNAIQFGTAEDKPAPNAFVY